MSLLFPRVARNLAKAGYYPTDIDTVNACKRLVTPAEDVNSLSILDPCCGLGEALTAFSEHLGAKEAITQSYGIEFDEERAYKAKQSLDTCIHADINDCVLGTQQFSLLFLNPPYGDKVTDHYHVENTDGSVNRLEKLFYQRCFSSLVFGGVLVLILPEYSFDKQYRRWLERNFGRLMVRRACDSRFKQLVVLGVRKRTSTSTLQCDRNTLDQLEAVSKGDIDVPRIDCDDQCRYWLPETSNVKKFHFIRMDSKQLSEAIGEPHQSGLWPQFKATFNGSKRSALQPLCQMSQWHMALALAGGQLNGLVESGDGKKLLVKGDTFKSKKVTKEIQLDAKGNVTEIQVSTDTFVPSIVGLDFTANSQTYGDLVRIK